MNKGHKATLFVISAPSGAGKTSLVRALVAKLDELRLSISHTTRPPRPDDKEGEDYFFVDKNHFKTMVQDEAFLEHATIYGYYYGTAKHWVFDQLKWGNDVILEIDWQGARQIRKLFPPAKLIFILPPSAGALRERLMKRQQDTAAVIDQRLAFAHDEMVHYREFDYILVNDDFDKALKDLVTIVHAERLQLDVQEEKLAPLLADLLKKQ